MSLWFSKAKKECDRKNYIMVSIFEKHADTLVDVSGQLEKKNINRVKAGKVFLSYVKLLWYFFL